MVCVELFGRVYDDCISAKHMRIIGPICFGYVTFYTTGRVKICFVFDPVDGVIGQT